MQSDQIRRPCRSIGFSFARRRKRLVGTVTIRPGLNRLMFDHATRLDIGYGLERL